MKREEIIEVVKRHICEVIPEIEESDIKLSDSLSDIGANSVDRAEILMLIMEGTSLQIPRVELFGAKNIEELVELLYEKL